MSLLHNRISNKELKEKLYQENFSRTTISFYKYCSIPNPQVFRDELYKGLSALQCFGRIYIAKEGINAQMSVPSHFFENFKEYLYTIPELNNVRLNIAVNDNGKSFIRRWLWYFDSGRVFSLAEWHDAYVFDVVRREFNGLTENNLSKGVHGLNVWPSTELSKYMTHFKGNSKNNLST